MHTIIPTLLPVLFLVFFILLIPVSFAISGMIKAISYQLENQNELAKKWIKRSIIGWTTLFLTQTLLYIILSNIIL